MSVVTTAAGVLAPTRIFINDQSPRSPWTYPIEAPSGDQLGQS